MLSTLLDATEMARVGQVAVARKAFEPLELGNCGSESQPGGAGPITEHL